MSGTPVTSEWPCFFLLNTGLIAGIPFIVSNLLSFFKDKTTPTLASHWPAVCLCFPPEESQLGLFPAPLCSQKTYIKASALLGNSSVAGKVS